MKLKLKVQELERQLAEIKKQVQSDKVVITDSSNPELTVEIALNNGEFTIKKITSTSQQINQLILKNDE